MHCIAGFCRITIVLEVEVLPDGTVLVPKAALAVDAGFVANPKRATTQMEGALIMAMSNVLYSEVSFAEGKMVQSNFRDYGVTRVRAASRVVDVHLMRSRGCPAALLSRAYRGRWRDCERDLYSHWCA